MCKKFCIVILLISFNPSNGSLKKHCLSNDTNPYELFGGISLYEPIRGTAGSDSICKPVQFWSFHRHGTRYPNRYEISFMRELDQMRDQIIESYESGKNLPDDSLCKEDFAKLKAWKWNQAIDAMPVDLTGNGWDEIKEIAKRYQARYPSLLSKKYNPDDYVFRHTIERRAKDSLHAFIEGLFDNDPADDIQIPPPVKRDSIIRPYKICNAWKKNVDQSLNRQIEANHFRKSDVFQQMVTDVSTRLGFNETLSTGQIETMYNNCRYHKSWFPNKISAWCTVFNKQELIYLEYLDDLLTYYKSSYGNIYSSKLGCKGIEYLMEEFEKTILNQEAKPKAIHLFSHDTMLIMILSAMDAFKDPEVLSGRQYQEFMINRLFKNSIISPFAANLVAVLHKCSDEIDDYEVQFFINERPLEMEGCRKGLCSWKYMKNRFSHLFPCNLSICESDTLITENLNNKR